MNWKTSPCSSGSALCVYLVSAIVFAGDPLQCGAWVGQCALYIVIMMFEKTIIIIVLLIPQWKKVCISLPASDGSPRASLAKGNVSVNKRGY